MIIIMAYINLRYIMIACESLIARHRKQWKVDRG